MFGGRGRRWRAVRLFIAAYPSPPAVAHLDAVLAPLRSTAAVRWAPVAHWHLTACFLGDVPDALVPDVSAAAGIAAARMSPFRLLLSGGGRFGGRGGPVVWAGVGGAVEHFVDLSAAVGTAARDAGATYPDRRPTPHLTLGRAARGSRTSALDRVIDVLAGYTGPPWEVTELRVVQSRLGPPVRHETVATLPLAPTSAP